MNVRKVKIMESVSCKKMLVRLNRKTDSVNEKWEHFRFIPRSGLVT